nr:MAG TPA: hypothetical protein [Caudoviricetes sp.]
MKKQKRKSLLTTIRILFLSRGNKMKRGSYL